MQPSDDRQHSSDEAAAVGPSGHSSLQDNPWFRPAEDGSPSPQAPPGDTASPAAPKEAGAQSKAADRLPVPPLRFPSSLPRRMSGYDRSATEKLFDDLAASYEKLWLEGERLRERMVSLEGDIDQRQEERRLLGQALVDAKRSALELREEARREAEATVAKARARAEHLVQEAERRASSRAREILSGAEEDHARLQAEVERLQQFASEAQRELSSFLLSALRWCKNNGGPGLPGLDAELAGVLEKAQPEGSRVGEAQPGTSSSDEGV